jgi:hypothetical protein
VTVDITLVRVVDQETESTIGAAAAVAAAVVVVAPNLRIREVMTLGGDNRPREVAAAVRRTSGAAMGRCAEATSRPSVAVLVVRTREVVRAIAMVSVVAAVRVTTAVTAVCRLPTTSVAGRVVAICLHSVEAVVVLTTAAAMAVHCRPAGVVGVGTMNAAALGQAGHHNAEAMLGRTVVAMAAAAAAVVVGSTPATHTQTPVEQLLQTHGEETVRYLPVRVLRRRAVCMEVVGGQRVRATA